MLPFTMEPYNTQPFQSTHSRWRATTQRDAAAHFSFLYGVKSTKIYCRPTCSARLARRANVVFYDTRDQARRDGFRACQRCKPDDEAFLGEREEIVTRALAALKTRKGEGAMKQSLQQLAEDVGVTPSYLCRVFKKTMGMTVGAYIREFEREGEDDESSMSRQAPTNLVGIETSDIDTTLSTPSALSWPSSRSDSAIMSQNNINPILGSPDIPSPTTAVAADQTLFHGLSDGIGVDPFVRTTREQQFTVPAEATISTTYDPATSYGIEEPIDLDLDFDFDDWLWKEGFQPESFGAFDTFHSSSATTNIPND